MNVQAWTFVMVAVSFAIYIGVAMWARAHSTGEFYVASARVPPVLNGMATGADWMSAASFISMAGLIAFMGRDGSVYSWAGPVATYCLRSSSLPTCENSVSTRCRISSAIGITRPGVVYKLGEYRTHRVRRQERRWHHPVPGPDVRHAQ